MTKTAKPENVVHVIGGGLAGSEAAFQIAQRGVPVILHEMRPVRMTDAHQTRAWRSLSVPIASGLTMLNPMPSACCMKKCG